MVANDRHTVCISMSKKENVLVPVSAESRNKWLQQWLDPGVQMMLSEICLMALLSLVLAFFTGSLPICDAKYHQLRSLS